MNKEQSISFVVNKEDKSVKIVNSKDNDTYNKVIPGFYSIDIKTSMFGTSVTICQEDIKIPFSAMTTVKTILNVKELDVLFSEESLRIHEAMNIPAKIGYLLHGEPGSGKTTTMLAVSQYLIDKYGAISVEVDTVHEFKMAFEFIKACRTVTPSIMAVITLDECDEYMDDYETEIKRLLDSNETPTNLVILGATNYIDQIPDAIKNRQSRFKHVIDCSGLNSEADQVFEIFSAMNKSLATTDQLTIDQLNLITLKGSGKTIDDLKHIFVDESVKLLLKAKAKPAKKISVRKKMNVELV